jgi:hypothetical protein
VWSKLNLAPGEVHQRQGRGDLEVGWAVLIGTAGGRLCVHRPDGRLQPGNQLDQFGRRAGSPIDGHPLLDPVEVGRSENPAAVSGGREHGSNHRGGRALALGPRHVDDRQRPLGIAQPGHQLVHPVELQFFCPIGHRGHALVVDAVLQEPQGGLAPGEIPLNAAG